MKPPPQGVVIGSVAFIGVPCHVVDIVGIDFSKPLAALVPTEAGDALEVAVCNFPKYEPADGVLACSIVVQTLSYYAHNLSLDT